jgi:hypothetical protein
MPRLPFLVRSAGLLSLALALAAGDAPPVAPQPTAPGTVKPPTTASSAKPDTQQAPPPDRTIRVADADGWWRPGKPFATEDPIQPFAGDPPTKAFQGKELAEFVDAYVGRIEEHYASQAPDGFISWLGAHAQLRRDFWLALSPLYDDVKAAMGVLDQLRAHDEKRTLACSHLAIAFAVVWDTPDAVRTSRLTGIWGVKASQFEPLPPLLECFDYFTVKPAAPLSFDPTQLAWPVLVHLVDYDVTAEESSWAAKACASYRTSIGSTYDKVPYDYTKLNREGSALGSREYSLQNLLQYGGVCGDRAHFTTRVAKSFGIPAMVCCGENRYGSLHAWAGNLVARNGRPQLDFSGRFDFDYYYTGDVFDPQTRTTVLDRTVAMVYDGLSQSYQKYSESMALSRAAAKLWATDRAAAILLARQAVDRDVYNPGAWNLLADAVEAGAITGKDAEKLVNRMLGDLAAHPDLTLACLGRFMDCLPKDKVDARQAVYEQALKLYAQRPDLQIKLRMAQCDELKAAKREPKALEVALLTVVANAKEGGLILPLTKQVVETAKGYAATNKGFKVDVVKAQLAKAAKEFPQQRGNEVSKSWLEFQSLTDGL